MSTWKQACFVVLFFSWAIFGQNSLTISIENKSKSTLEWSRSKIFHPGTRIDIVPKTILPGGTATITAEVPEGVDLSARIFFTNDDMLRIDDFQQARPISSIFKINSSRIASTIKRLKENPEKNLAKISYVYVDMHLHDSH